MSEYRELRTISLDFRRISSNLLSSDDGDADVNLHRLMDYIEKTPFIHDRVHSVVDQVEYDFQVVIIKIYAAQKMLNQFFLVRYIAYFSVLEFL